MHVVLRLSRRSSDIDLILNILGMTNLAIAVVILAVGLAMHRRRLGRPVPPGDQPPDHRRVGHRHRGRRLQAAAGGAGLAGIVLQILGIVSWLPLGMTFMRSPL